MWQTGKDCASTRQARHKVQAEEDAGEAEGPVSGITSNEAVIKEVLPGLLGEEDNDEPA